MINRRHVLFVHGFDARGAKHYYEFFREEARKDASRAGGSCSFSPALPTPDGRVRWTIDRTGHGRGAQTTFDYMMWDDIVRAHVRLGMLRTFGKALVDVGALQRRGWFGAIRRADRSMGALCLYPYVMCLLYVLTAVAAAVGAGLLAGAAGMPGWLSAAVGVLGFIAVMRLARRFDRVMYVLYLIRDFSFILAQSRGETPEMEARLERFAEAIRTAALDEETDEVLVVGHSSGSFEVTAALARALKTLPEETNISLLTVGQAIPLLSALPEAVDFPRELREVAQAPQVHWVDISSPMDSVCVALRDPVPPAPDAATHGGQASPKILSARLRRCFSKATLGRLRFRIFDMHFVYFLANDMPCDWNWLDICCGPLSLPKRFAGRASRPRAA